MLGHSHVIVGGAGFLAIGAPILALAGVHLSPAELGAGAVVGAGSAMLPDLDHPQATVSRSLGPLTESLSKFTATISGGHRQGTHSLLAAGLVGGGLALLLRTPGPWIGLGIAWFCTSLLLRTLTDARSLVNIILSGIIAATIITIAPHLHWMWATVALGMLLHDFADMLTIEGIPPFWPITKWRLKVPLVGHTDSHREHMVALFCGVAAAFLAWFSVFSPLWRPQNIIPYKQNGSSQVQKARKPALSPLEKLIQQAKKKIQH
jgi:membrane-bound metal-dependent hydrolase YbcI (DUF457 family)